MSDTERFENDPHEREPVPNVRPRDAATLILLDRTATVPKVLMGRRHERHVFLPGKFVFPGGRLDPTDRLMSTTTALDPRAEKRLMQRMSRPSADKARALALTAIRETFEETGLLIGRKCTGIADAPVGPWAEFANAKVEPDLATIHFIARAITPPRRPRRYDTRFFTADANAIVHRIDGRVGADAELVELVWIPLPDAETLDLIPITRLILRDLRAQIVSGFSHDEPIPFYRMLHGKRSRELI